MSHPIPEMDRGARAYNAILRERRLAAQAKEREDLLQDTRQPEIDPSTGQVQDIRVRRRGQLSSEVATHTTDSLARSRALLMETVSRSSATLEQLGLSSAKIEDTQTELVDQRATIGTARTLLTKYGRREWTDKFLIFLAFLMFLGVVVYIVHKRFF